VTGKSENQAISKSKTNHKPDREMRLYTPPNVLGRTFDELLEVYEKFATKKNP